VSASATFELPAGLDFEAIRAKARAIWTDFDVELLNEPPHPATLHLDYYYDSGQDSELIEIARMLLCECEGQPLYYYREWGVCVPGQTPDYPRLISIGELASREFRPAMHDGTHHRYRLADDVQ
jgi:hypothetical protein